MCSFLCSSHSATSFVLWHRGNKLVLPRFSLCQSTCGKWCPTYSVDLHQCICGLSSGEELISAAYNLTFYQLVCELTDMQTSWCHFEVEKCNTRGGESFGACQTEKLPQVSQPSGFAAAVAICAFCVYIYTPAGLLFTRVMKAHTDEAHTPRHRWAILWEIYCSWKSKSFCRRHICFCLR